MEKPGAYYDMVHRALLEMRPPCTACGQKYDGASWSGRCYDCHDRSLVPYESGEDFIAWRDL